MFFNLKGWSPIKGKHILVCVLKVLATRQRRVETVFVIKRKNILLINSHVFECYFISKKIFSLDYH